MDWEGHIFTSQMIAYPMDTGGTMPEFNWQRWLWPELKKLYNKNMHFSVILVSLTGFKWYLWII